MVGRRRNDDLMSSKSMVGFIADLSCKHKALYNPSPEVNEIVFCRRCNDYRAVLRVGKAWRMRCNTCSRTYEYGADQGRIRRVAVRHLRLFADHDVWVMGGDEEAEQITSVGQVPLPICDLQPGSGAVE